MGDIQRVSTGIPGLDELMEGGFVKNSINLVSGGTGTGKTIFSSQFILDGLKKGENGLYLSLEQSPEDIKRDLARFGFDFSTYINEKKCILEKIPPVDIEDLEMIVFDRVNQIGAKRFVLDSLALVEGGDLDPKDLRTNIAELFEKLRKSGCTTLFISEIPEGSEALSKFGVEEFMVDGVLVLNYLKFAAAGSPRSVVIRKMRRTKHGSDVYPFEIGKNGIKLVTEP
jgi:KaiC/GvpD/RAD55 family RecA-like ATPase